METIAINNVLEDDQLINLIKENFNENDMQLFNLNYKFYIANKNNPNDFIVDLAEVWEWIGFSNKGNAKKLLESKNLENNFFFEINKDYIIKKVFILKDKNLGGRPANKILLTIGCFKKYCLRAGTSKSSVIYDYYIKMEEIITKYVENKHKEIIENNKKMLELKDNETNQILQLKDNEIEKNKKLLELKDLKTKEILQLKDIETNEILELKNQEIENNKMLLEDTLMKLQIKESEINSLKTLKYEEIDKNKHIYVFSTDKDRIYKVGKTKDVKERKKSLQTGNVDDIITLYDYHTSDDSLLEQIIHNILNSYRCQSGREHFSCNLEYIKLIIDIAGKFLDTLKSTYEHITKDELIIIIKNKILEINNLSSVQENIVSVDNIIEPDISNAGTTELSQNIENIIVIESDIIDAGPTELSPNTENITVSEPEIIENNPIKSFLDEHFTITKNNKDKILCSEFNKKYNLYNSNKISSIKIKKDMLFNGFEEHKNSGNRYYYGLIIKNNQQNSINI